MKQFLLLTVLALFSAVIFAQAPPASSFGGFHEVVPDIRDEISEEHRMQMYGEVRQNIRDLAQRGITAESALQRKKSTTKFVFPLRPAQGFNDPGYFGISNFPDVDPGTGIQDQNCGRRTYDGHLGTDFFTAPFWWKKMDEDAVEIVAAADGIIVARQEQRDDRSCQMCPAGSPNTCFLWNAVYLQHADGTLTMYGHMKKNSLTSKVVGDAVSSGEFLGIVGSSGNSSGPHLHFEVWQDTFFSKLLNPWEGNCNPDGNASMWEEQPTYYQNDILKLMSGSAIPEVKACYDGQPEKTFEKSSFALGTETVYLTAFVRDNRVGNPPYRLTLYRPDGSIQYNWTLAPFNAYYSWAYLYYTFGPAELTVAGEYTFRLIYDKDTTAIRFNLFSPTPLDLISFTGMGTPDGNLLQWQTENEVHTDGFEIQRSNDGTEFTAIGSVGSKEGSGRLHYEYADPSPGAGTTFYRLRMLDQDGTFKYSPVIKVVNLHKASLKLYPNPAQNFVVLQGVSDFRTAVVIDMQGRNWTKMPLSGDQVRIDLSNLPAGTYFIRLDHDSFSRKLKFVKN